MHLCAIVVLVSVLAGIACQRAPAPLAGGSRDGEQAAAGGSAAGTPIGAASTARAPAKAVPAPPAVRDVTIPEGTTLSVVLETPLASDTSRVEDPVRAHLAVPVKVDGVDALPAGSAVHGVVGAAEQSGKVKGRAHLAVRFTGVTRDGETDRYAIETSDLERTAAATKKKDAATIGLPAAGGAIVGGIIGGGKGAAIGTAVGGGAGTAVVLSTRGEEVRLASGATLKVRLTAPVTVRVPRG